MVEARGSRRFALVFLVAAFAVLLLGRWVRPVDNVLLSVAAPFVAVGSGVSGAIGDTISGVVEGPRYRAEDIALRRQVGFLLRQNLLLQEEAHQNKMLVRMLHFQNLNPRLVLEPALVIASDPNNLSPSIVINRGRRDGLRVGMTVLDHNGYFVGQVSDLTSNAAKVLLMVSPSSSVGAMDLGTRATGVVEGQYAALPELKFVVTSAVLHPGDFVVTSGQSDLFPRSVPLGQITRVQRSDVSEFQTAVLQPAADFQNLEMVQVVRNFIPSAPVKLLQP